MIKVVYDGKDISELVSSVEWSGYVDRCCREVNVTLINTQDSRNKIVKFENGKSVDFYFDSARLFRGVLFTHDIDLSGTSNLIAFDENVYLMKNFESRKFTNMKASDIVRRLCADFGIPIGQINDTGYVIPKLIIRNESLFDIIKKALTLTRKQTGKRFFIGNKDGKLMLMQAKDQASKYVIEVGVNLTGASYSQSIEEMKTQVKVMGGSEKAPIQALAKSPLTSKFGVMQLVEEIGEKSTKAQVEQRAAELLKELAVINDQANVDSLGIKEVISGTAVYVKEPLTGLVGGYYVSNDAHYFDANGSHTMSLELSATYDLPAMEVTKEELGVE